MTFSPITDGEENTQKTSAESRGGRGGDEGWRQLAHAAAAAATPSQRSLVCARPCPVPLLTVRKHAQQQHRRHSEGLEADQLQDVPRYEAGNEVVAAGVGGAVEERMEMGR